MIQKQDNEGKNQNQTWKRFRKPDVVFAGLSALTVAAIEIFGDLSGLPSWLTKPAITLLTVFAAMLGAVNFAKRQ